MMLSALVGDRSPWSGADHSPVTHRGWLLLPVGDPVALGRHNRKVP
ncbi:MAG: hypothetical protein LBF51_04895 [Zoogloeaceae bacterium]|nr:hypothetical protein [Zoogloeaceae bacterium]